MSAIDIIKGAILLERKGKAFYESVAKQTQNQAVRGIFEIMSNEEATHIELLSKHYESLIKQGKLNAMDYEGEPEKVSIAVLTSQIKKEVSAAGFEAAAISAAMAMEEKAVVYYSQRASNTDDPLEKELYEWLANWEKTHLQFLSDIDNELRESIWYDNRFWPLA